MHVGGDELARYRVPGPRAFGVPPAEAAERHAQGQGHEHQPALTPLYVKTSV